MDIEELLRAIGYRSEQRVKHAAFKLSREARLWWCAKRDMLTRELGSKEALLFGPDSRRSFARDTLQTQ